MNKDPDIAPEESPLNRLNRKSDVCITKNGIDAKHTRNISRRVDFLRKGKNSKMYKIDLCEGDLQLEDRMLVRII